MPRTDDNASRGIAEQINQSRPQWLVIWGSYSRRFWAYPLFEMRPRRLVSAGYPDALIARMDEAERRYRVMPQHEEPTNDDPDDQ